MPEMEEMDDLARRLKQANDDAMSGNKDWRELMDRVRAYVGDGSDRGFKATYLLGALLGICVEGKMTVVDAVKVALIMVELSPPDRSKETP